MPDAVLRVSGTEYRGWETLRVTRSLDSLAGSFAVTASDRWGDGESWPIAEEDEVRVELGGEVVIDGWIDSRTLAIAPNRRLLSLAGRDRAGALVDCSVDLDRWTLHRASLLDVALELASPHGIAVGVQAGLTLPTPAAKTVLHPGDTGHAALRRAAETAGLLAVSDGAGGVLLTRAGSAQAADLVEGQNILSASISYQAQRRFATYALLTQIPGTDTSYGDATRIRAEATDAGVKRTDRTRVIMPQAGITKASAKQRADWEARARAAKAQTVTISTVGWQQPSGTLWPINALSYVKAPSLGIDGRMLIAQVDFSISNQGGEVTTLRLVRPDAYTPQPDAIVKPAGKTGTARGQGLFT